MVYSITLFKDGLRRRNLPTLTLRKVLAPRNDGSVAVIIQTDNFIEV